MSGILVILGVLCCLAELSMTEPIYIKENGVYKQVAGDYLVIPLNNTHQARHKREISRGWVYLNGAKRQVSEAEVYRLYTTLSEPERRSVLAHPDEESTGDCDVRETFTWPGRCYPVSGGRLSICRSNARGIIEITSAGCTRNFNLADYLRARGDES